VLAIGGAYAVSALLIVYVHQNGLLGEELALPVLVAWAAVGLVLATIAALKKEDR